MNGTVFSNRKMLMQYPRGYNFLWRDVPEDYYISISGYGNVAVFVLKVSQTMGKQNQVAGVIA